MARCHRCQTPVSTSAGDVSASYVDVTASLVDVSSPANSHPEVCNASSIGVLKFVSDLLRDEATLDHPLCASCSLALSEEIERQISDAEADCIAYEAALKRLEGEELSEEPASEEAMRAELARAAEDEKRELAKLAELEQKLKVAELEQKDLERNADELKELEEKYWSSYNSYRMQLQTYSEDKSALLSKIESTCAQLELLKRTNIYNDAFHIWHR